MGEPDRERVPEPREMRVRRTAGATVAAAVLLCLAPSPSAGETVVFVVAENPALFAEGSESCFHCDSYLLPLSDPDDIADARDIVARGGQGLGTIAIADIAAGSDGLNRDVLAPGEPLWSWHVTGFQGFADLGIEILDGWPTFVESDVEGWIANTGGAIGFWNYTVVEELPEPSGALSGLAAVLTLVVLRATIGNAARGAHARPPDARRAPRAA